jgi:hypothetical protein
MTRTKQHIGSHTNHRRPDQMMGRRHGWTSTMRKVQKRLAAKKRRQTR